MKKNSKIVNKELYAIKTIKFINRVIKDQINHYKLKFFTPNKKLPMIAKKMCFS